MHNHIFSKKHLKSRNSAQGFTLIELLVSMALLAILGGIGVSIFAVINGAYDQANAISKMQTQGSQVLEVLERSIRGATDVTTTSQSVGCNYDQCLIIGVPSSSLEYQINGGCSKTVYGWGAKTSTNNGTLVRYYLDNANAACNGSTPIELFDTHPRNGVNVEQNGASNIFTTNTGADGIDSVTINLKLTEGIQITTKPANIPIKTTVSLRDY